MEIQFWKDRLSLKIRVCYKGLERADVVEGFEKEA